jgi:hypothetical protein
LNDQAPADAKNHDTLLPLISMNSIDATRDTRTPSWPRVLGWALAVIAALGVFVAYLDPGLMVALGNAVWSCF